LLNSMSSLNPNVGGLSHLGCAWGQQMRGNNVAREGGGLKNIACDTSRTACPVAVSPVMCIVLHNTCCVNSVVTSSLNSRMNLHLGAKIRYKVRIVTWNIGILTARSRELKY